MSQAEPIGSDAEQRLRARLASDLRVAIKTRNTTEIAPIRSLLAALDNAGAVALDGLNAPVFGRAGDVSRRDLSPKDVHKALSTEIAEREAAIASYLGLGQADAADRLRLELEVLERYRADLASGDH
jgi:uncharacterized protein YqeY